VQHAPGHSGNEAWKVIVLSAAPLSCPPPQDLLGCSRLVGLEGKLHCFNACLDRYVFGDTGGHRQLPRGCLPALPTLSLLAVAGDAQHEAPGFLARELSALTGLTSLAVEGPAVVLLTQRQWKELRWQTEEWCDEGSEGESDGGSCDSDTLEQSSLGNHLGVFGPLAMPDPGFHLPHLRELSLISCSLKAVPQFVAGAADAPREALAAHSHCWCSSMCPSSMLQVHARVPPRRCCWHHAAHPSVSPVRSSCAGLPELHTLRLNGNIFSRARMKGFLPRTLGPLRSSLRRLEMRGCFMPGVPLLLSRLTALTALDLSGNRQLELRRSDVGIFSCLTSLHELVSFGAGQAGENCLVWTCLCHAVLCMQAH